jgi:hypothetical protein
MKNAQQRLDQGAKRARKLEAETREFAEMVRDAADHACDAGEFALSADLHDIAGMYEAAAATMRRAYAIGRRIKAMDDDTGGMVQPMGGGKD